MDRLHRTFAREISDADRTKGPFRNKSAGLEREALNESRPAAWANIEVISEQALSPLIRQCLDATVARLADELRGFFSGETVARYVEESYEQAGDRPAVGPNLLPVIIERFARERLWAIAQATGIVEKPLPEVLFVCSTTRDAVTRQPR
jgi:hypothetical protein